MTNEEPDLATPGEAKLIKDPLSKIDALTSTSPTKTLAETKLKAAGWINAQECEPPSMVTDFGEMESSCGRLSGKKTNGVGTSRT